MMKIVFFAALREQLGCSEYALTTDEQINTVADVKRALAQQNPHWATYVESSALLAAVNHEMAANDHPVNAGDEVAFFPPVTGG